MNEIKFDIKSQPVKVEYKNAPYWGIPTGSVARKYFFRKLSEFKKYTGWIVKNGKISEWRIDGLCDLDDNTYFYGSFLEGRILAEFYQAGSDDWQDLLIRLLEAYLVLCKEIEAEFILYSQSVICLQDGGLLFLPPQLMSEIIAVSNDAVQQQQRELLNHPYLSGQESVAYFTGVFAYNQIAGELPFAPGKEDDVKSRVRNQKLLPLEYRIPGLKKDVSNFIQEALFQRNNPLPTLKQWITRLKNWQQEGLFREISAEEKAILEEKAVLQTKLLEKRFKTTHFLQQNRSKIITISLVSAILLFIIGSLFYNVFLKPRSTVNMDPLELVETFYRSITAVDFPTLDDCVLKGAAKADVGEVMNLYVISRQQMAVTNTSSIYPADKWTEDGRPPVLPGRQIYGIANLIIREMSNTNTPAFMAEYEKWYSEVESEDLAIEASEIVYYGKSITDHLFLIMDRGGWIIQRLDRVRSEDIEFNPGEPMQ